MTRFILEMNDTIVRYHLNFDMQPGQIGAGKECVSTGPGERVVSADDELLLEVKLKMLELMSIIAAKEELCQ